MQSYHLHIENFMSIEAMDIQLSGIKGFCGKNASGKTSVLKALQALLSGSSSDSKLIKDGEKRSLVRIDEYSDDGELTRSVQRVQTHGGARMEAKGLGSVSPMLYLGTLLDRVAVNPVELLAKNPVEYMKNHLPARLTNLDCSGFQEEIAKAGGVELDKNAFRECDRVSKAVGDERLLVYRDLQHATELVEELRKNLPELPEAPRRDRTEIYGDQRKANDSRAEMQVLRRQQVESEQKRTELTQEREKSLLSSDMALTTITTLEGRLTAATPWETAEIDKLMVIRDNAQVAAKVRYETELASIAAQHERSCSDVSRRRQESETAIRLDIEKHRQADALAIQSIKHIDAQLTSIAQMDFMAAPEREIELNQKTEALKVELAAFETWENVNRQHQQVEAKESERLEIEAKHKKLDTAYKYFAYVLPRQLLERCQLPVPGIQFIENELHVEEDGNLRHIDQLSTAQRAIVAIKLGIALAKARGHIAISFDGIESLDAEHRAQFIQVAKDSGMAVLYTRCGEPEYGHEVKISKDAGMIGGFES